MTRKRRIGVALIATGVLIIGAGLILLKPPAKPVPAPPVTLASGSIEGMREGEVTIYRGIPFAAAPIGELRWKPPQPPAKTEGLFIADRFKPVCPQIGEPLEGLGPEPMDEDCLGLNIWTAAKSAEQRRPVIVFLSGGGFVKGGGSSRLYWGGPLAKEGVVLVTLNYRIGALGFLAHPEGASGNYALLDVIAALHWVQDNIAAFGGDPANVTLMGHSAGAYIASDLMTSPLAHGLFRRVIGMSGGDLGAGQMPTLVKAEQNGKEFQQILGAASLGDMRKLPAMDIVAKGGPDRPAVDGQILPRDARTAMEEGEGGDLDLMVGYTAGEEDDFPWRSQQWAEIHARTGHGKTWLYQFSKVPPWPPFKETKVAGHGAELPYVFGYPDSVAFFILEAPWKAWRDARVASEMRKAWVNFAKSGDPGNSAWQRYVDGKPMLADFGDGGVQSAVPQLAH